MDVIVLGVDGVDPVYLEKALNRYDLPHWERLVHESFYTELPSTIPAVTLPAWPVMFSGYEPDRFEIYHLNKPDYEEWTVEFPDSTAFRGKCLWDNVDVTVGLHYVPGTSPVYPVNGWMRGGFPSPHDFEFFPAEFEEEVRQDVDLTRKEANTKIRAETKISAALDNYETERRISEIIWSKDPNLFISVIRMTDQVSHFAESETHLLEGYRAVDEEIGKMVQRAEEENSNLLVVSDHGFMHGKKKFNVLQFLLEEGFASATDAEDQSFLYRMVQPLLQTRMKRYVKYLHDFVSNVFGADFSPRSSGPLAALEKSSKVLPFHFGLGQECALKIHSEDMPHGVVPEHRVETLRDELIAALRSVEHNGEPVVETVWRGEELYPRADIRPDLVFRTRPGIIVDTTDQGAVISNTNSFTHRRNGVFFAKGPDIDVDAEVEMEITDVAPLLYALLDESIPPDLDGVFPAEVAPELHPGRGGVDREVVDAVEL